MDLWIEFYFTLSEKWAVGVMGCRSNGLSELWAVGIMLRTRFKDLSTVYRNYLGYAYHDEMVGASYKNRPFPLECVDLSYSI